MNTERFKFRVAIKQADGTYKRYNAHRIGWDARGLYAKVAIPKNDKEFFIDDIVIDGDNAILEQSTGLKDKNGNLIYEGAVVRYYRSTAMGLGGERIASVAWDDRCGAWYILTTLGDGYDMYDALNFGIEIIGNIHDNEVAE